MKIALFSDLHTEFDSKHPWSPEPLEADVIVFAGDNVTSPSLLHEYAQRVEQQQTRALHILYVCGNHEFYGNLRHYLYQSNRNHPLLDPRSSGAWEIAGSAQLPDHRLLGFTDRVGSLKAIAKFRPACRNALYMVSNDAAA